MKKTKVFLAVFCILSILTVMSIACFADAASDLTSMNTEITTALADFSTSNLAMIFVAALGITVTLVLGWFAFRFISRKVSGALKKGRV